MANKQLTFSLLIAVYGVDKNVPVVVTITNKKATATRDGLELKADSVDKNFLPEEGTFNVTLVSSEIQDAIVVKTAAAKPPKQSPTFDSY